MYRVGGAALLALVTLVAGCAGHPDAPTGTSAASRADVKPGAGAVTATPAQIFADTPQSP